MNITTLDMDRVKKYDIPCQECKKGKGPLIRIEGLGFEPTDLCPSCLQTLRSKIDAFSILITQGIDTK